MSDEKDKKEEQEGQKQEGTQQQWQPPEGYVLIPKEQLERMSQTDYLDRNAGNFSDAGPTFEERLTDYDKRLDDIDSKLDTAYEDEDTKKIRALSREKERIQLERTRFYTDERINSAVREASGVISQLTTEVNLKNLPHWNIVKADVEKALARMSPEMRANGDNQKAVYYHAVGLNYDKIQNAERETLLRKEAESKANDTGADTGREKESSGAPPSFEEYFGSQYITSLKQAGKTPESFVRGLRIPGVNTPEDYVKFAIAQEEGGEYNA